MSIRSKRAGALLISSDVALIEPVAAIAGAVGLPLDVRPRTEATLWEGASIVLIGADLIEDVAALRPARRAGVLVVALGTDDRVWRPALEVGAEHVAFLPVAETWLSDQLADAAEGPGRAGDVVGVIAGCGGAGASTLAAGLSQAAAQAGLHPLLVDLDPLGAGVDLLLGAEREPGRRWPDLRSVRGRLAAEVLVDSLPAAHGVRILTWDRGNSEQVAAGAVHSVLAAGRRGHDLVIVDLPRQFCGAGLVSPSHLDQVLMVTTDDLRGAVAAGRAASLLGEVRLGLVVRRRGGALTPSDVAGIAGVELRAELRNEFEVAAAAERGDPPLIRRGPLREVCRRLVNEVSNDRAA